MVDFYADWCPPCRNIAPKYAEHSEVVKEYATLVKVNGDKNTESKNACKIEAYPTFIFYKKGEKLHEFAGADFEELKKKIEEYK